MLVTLNMLIAALGDHPIENRVDDLDRIRVEGITLLCGGEKADGRFRDRLIVCGPDRVGEAAAAGYGAIVCVCGAGSSLPEDADVIAVYDDVEPAEIYQKLSERYVSIMDWRLRMAEGMANGCSLQEIGRAHV